MGEATVSRQSVARLRLRRQGLTASPGEEMAWGGAAEVIARLGQVQVDPMNVVARSVHLVLWSRCPDYREVDLNSLYTTPPRVFEYWSRVASMLSMELYPLVAPTMKVKRRDNWWGRWIEEWLEAKGDVAESVLAEVEKRGALASRDFPSDKKQAGRWGSRKTAKEALEALWHVGELMVCERRRGEKVFDLTSRVLPQPPEPLDLPDEERIARLWQSALQAYGACTTGELSMLFGAAGWPPERKLKPEDVEEIARRRGLSVFCVKSIEGAWVCADETHEELANGVGKPARRMTLLSPFDAVIINRWMARALYDFDYKFEAYTPKVKRQYGSYVMPILWGDKLVRRLDPKLDRKQGTLLVQGLWLEPKVKADKTLAEELGKTLRGFAEFLGAEKVSLGKTQPAALKAELKKAL